VGGGAAGEVQLERLDRDLDDGPVLDLSNSVLEALADGVFMNAGLIRDRDTGLLKGEGPRLAPYRSLGRPVQLDTGSQLHPPRSDFLCSGRAGPHRRIPGTREQLTDPADSFDVRWKPNSYRNGLREARRTSLTRACRAEATVRDSIAFCGTTPALPAGAGARGWYERYEQLYLLSVPAPPPGQGERWAAVVDALHRATAARVVSGGELAAVGTMGTARLCFRPNQVR